MEIKFVDTEKRLSKGEVEYWKKVFDANLLFASEFECEYRNGGNSRIKRELEHTGDYKYFGNGIDEVKTDGSLRNGVEITLSPTRYYSFAQMYARYLDFSNKVMPYEPMIHERASWHNHVSLDNRNGVQAKEKDVPDIILKNTIALFRKYYPAFAYMSATLPEERGAYTRFNEFCHTSGINDFRSTDSYSTIKSEFDDRYNALNISHNKQGSFWIEFRYPDCTLFPMQMATQQGLLKALIMKAIELSQFGVVNSLVSSDIKDLWLFRNNPDDYEEDVFDDDNLEDYEYDNYDRISIPVRQHILDRLKDLANDLVSFLSDKLYQIDERLPFLASKLAEKPVFKIFRELDTSRIEEVNYYLADIVDKLYTPSDKTTEEVEKLIALGLVKTNTKKEWEEQAEKMVACETGIHNAILSIKKDRKIKFVKGLGYILA